MHSRVMGNPLYGSIVEDVTKDWTQQYQSSETTLGKHTSAFPPATKATSVVHTPVHYNPAVINWRRK